MGPPAATTQVRDAPPRSHPGPRSPPASVSCLAGVMTTGNGPATPCITDSRGWGQNRCLGSAGDAQMTERTRPGREAGAVEREDPPRAAERDRRRKESGWTQTGGDKKPEPSAGPLPHLRAAESGRAGWLGLSTHPAPAQGRTGAATSGPRENREQGLPSPPRVDGGLRLGGVPCPAPSPANGEPWVPRGALRKQQRHRARTGPGRKSAPCALGVGGRSGRRGLVPGVGAAGVAVAMTRATHTVTARPAAPGTREAPHQWQRRPGRRLLPVT